MHIGRKVSGGKYHRFRKKKLYEKDSQERIVALRDFEKRKVLKVRGGNLKTILLSADRVNVLVNGKVQRTTIKHVVETPQNFFLARQNRLLKGVIIDTALGKAKITNRPTQEGMVNAILLKKE